MTNPQVVLFAVIILALIFIFATICNQKKETFESKKKSKGKKYDDEDEEDYIKHGAEGKGYQYLSCRSSEDCVKGFTCTGNDKKGDNAGLCVKTCKSSDECGQYYTCSGNDEASGTEGKCVRRCIKRDDCLKGFTCDGNDFKTRKAGRCLLMQESFGNKGDEGDDDDSEKKWNYQYLGCMNDNDCMWGSLCSFNEKDSSTGARSGGICARKCYSSDDCGGSYVCKGNEEKSKRAGICAKSCKSSDDCLSGFTCRGNDKDKNKIGICMEKK